MLSRVFYLITSIHWALCLVHLIGHPCYNHSQWRHKSQFDVEIILPLSLLFILYKAAHFPSRVLCSGCPPLISYFLCVIVSLMTSTTTTTTKIAASLHSQQNSLQHLASKLKQEEKIAFAKRTFILDVERDLRYRFTHLLT